MFYLVFDGGNGGVAASKGYGSFKLYVEKGGELLLHEQEHQFEGSMTSNEAEYRTLIFALEKIQEFFCVTELIIEGDSELVRSQVLGLFKVKALHLQPLRDRVVSLLSGVNYTYNHVPRKVVVREFGH